MTVYERQCYFWLMRQLEIELGIRFDIVPGPKRKLTAGEARAVTVIVMSRPPGERESLIDRLSEHLRVGKTTLKRAMAPYRTKPEPAKSASQISSPVTIRRASSTDRAIPARPPSERIVSM